MKYAEINKRFSEIVESYLKGGWTIDTTTFRSLFSGENCRMTLTDGESNLYIRICEEHDWPYHKFILSVDFADKDTLSKNGVRPNIPHSDNLWSKYMKTLHSETYWKIGEAYYSDWFGTETEARNAVSVRKARQRLSSENETIDLTETKGAKEAALKWIHNHAYKTYKLTDIEAIYKKVYSYDGDAYSRYFVRARSKDFQME